MYRSKRKVAQHWKKVRAGFRGKLRKWKKVNAGVKKKTYSDVPQQLIQCKGCFKYKPKSEIIDDRYGVRCKNCDEALAVLRKHMKEQKT